jgi:hypothetical protein
MEQVDGGGPTAGEHHVADAEIGGELRFECFAFGAEDVVAAFDDLEDSAVDGLALVDAG